MNYGRKPLLVARFISLFLCVRIFALGRKGGALATDTGGEAASMSGHKYSEQREKIGALLLSLS